MPAPQVFPRYKGALVRATIQFENSCKDLRARVARGPGELEVTVTSRTRPHCIYGGFGVEWVTYDLQIDNLSHGPYRLRLIHTHLSGDGGSPSTSLDTVLTTTLP
jgi:hypothetical protein